jgi:methionyl-tRNA formyltransferase
VADKVALAKLVAGARFGSRVGLVVDFGIIIPAEVIASFELGIINSHFSLLPRLRGADPISFAILEGHDETGVSLMRIVPALDEGPLIAQESYRLPSDVTTPLLTQELSDMSTTLLREYLPKYIIGDITPWPQEAAVTPSYTRRLTKRDGELDWQKPAVELERQVRAFIGWPGSRTRLFGRDVTVTAAQVVAPAEVAANVPPDRLLMPCGGDSVLEILKLKPAGKREMAAADFLRGLPPAPSS